MIEIRKSHLIIAIGLFMNLGSGLLLTFFAVSDIYTRAISLLSGIILIRIAILIEDKLEQVYG